MSSPDARWNTVTSRWIAWAVAQFHRLLCHSLTEIAYHAIPHPELHLGCWAVAFGCRLVGGVLRHKRRWLKQIEHLARMLGGAE